MHVDRVLDFLGQTFDFKFFLKQFGIQTVLIVQKITDLIGSNFMIFDFTHDLSNFVFFAFNFVQSVLVLVFTFTQITLVDFDFFIKNLSFLISSDQLCSQNISFSHYEIVFFLQFLSILFTFFDNLVKFFNFFGSISDFNIFLV